MTHTEAVQSIEQLLVVMLELLKRDEIPEAKACMTAVIKLCHLYPDLEQMFDDVLAQVKRELYH